MNEKILIINPGSTSTKIVLTGGIAQSPQFTGLIAPRVRFLAPVDILPGENEMEALAQGRLRGVVQP